MRQGKPAAGGVRARQLEVRYMAGVDVPDAAPLRTPLQIAAVLRPIMEGRLVEALVVLHLDARHRLIGYEVSAIGALNVVHVSPRDVYRSALTVGAAAIIVSHNHPSGDASPSPDDLELTRRLRAAADLIGVPMLDHIVMGDGFYSFSEERLVHTPPAPSVLNPGSHRTT